MSTSQPIIRDSETMKIAIPMAEGKFSEHFGGAKAFLIFEGNLKTQRLGGKDVFGAPEHKPGALPKWLEEQQVDALVSSAIGERALKILEKAGIDVFLADGDTEPSALATACLSGRLVRANIENTRCHGDHHDHGDGHECHHH
jgi:ATP-binding protein involved in chromosome partitioning